MMNIDDCLIFGHDASKVARENGMTTEDVINAQMARWDAQEVKCEQCQWRHRRQDGHCYMFQEVVIGCRKFQEVE